MTQKLISDLTSAFQLKLTELHERMDFSPYKSTTLSLEVKFSKDSASFQLELCIDYDTKVVGTDLDELFVETYRRLNWQDKEAGKMNLRQLSGPVKSEAKFEIQAKLDDEISF